MTCAHALTEWDVERRHCRACDREAARARRRARRKLGRGALSRSSPERWGEERAAVRDRVMHSMSRLGTVHIPTHGGSRAGVFVPGVTPEVLRGRCIAADPVSRTPRWARIENAPPQWRLLLEV